jgi:hypothetical protein
VLATEFKQDSNLPVLEGELGFNATLVKS